VNTPDELAMSESPRHSLVDVQGSTVRGGEPQRVAVGRAFAATGVAFADDVLRRVNVRLGEYTGAWVAERRAACEANVSGRQTDRVRDIRVACLERQRAGLVGEGAGHGG
jgi:hypothetical protein